MKSLLLALLFTIMNFGNHQNSPTMLKQFIKDITEAKLSNTEIGDRYFCTTLLHRTDSKGEMARGYLQFALSQQRSLLQEKHLNLDEVKFTPYSALSSSELPAKPFHLLGEAENVFVAQYHGKIICFFLIEDKKIASTFLIDQGGENYFINFCTGYPM